MSYIKAITISGNDIKVDQLNVEQLQSVTEYIINVTVDESQSMKLATNVSLVESQPIYSRSNDFNWTGIDNPSEIIQSAFAVVVSIFIWFLLCLSSWP